MSELRRSLDRAIARAALNKPADCTCDGLHTQFAPGMQRERVEALIAFEYSLGACPAELRALDRILDRLAS
jgi:hypothetical protein